MEVTPQDLVARAADLLGEYGWCRHAYAINEYGDQTTSRQGDAAAFCAVGALQRAALDYGICTWEKGDSNLFYDACNLVSHYVGCSITHWNDVQAKPGEVKRTLEMIADTAAMMNVPVGV